MDDPALPAAEHSAALAGLARLNAASRASTSLWAAIRTAAPPASGRQLSVLDVACGGGDVLRGLIRSARREGIELVAHGIDRSPTAIELAKQSCANDESITFSVADALRQDLPQRYDVVTTSLFVHHLTADEVVRLMQRLRNAATRAVVISDLRRSTIGYWLAQAACRLLSRSPVVHFDGPRSVEGALTMRELVDLANTAGLTPLSVCRQWPQRMLATWVAP